MRREAEWNVTRPAHSTHGMFASEMLLKKTNGATSTLSTQVPLAYEMFSLVYKKGLPAKAFHPEAIGILAVDPPG